MCACMAGAADGLNLAGFQKPQQQRLHPQAHFPDFVEKDRAGVRLPQEARVVAERAGEAAAGVPEELRLRAAMSGMPAQLIVMKGARFRPLRGCESTRATTSLPTPVSPVSRTLASERAAESMSAWMRCIASLSPRSETCFGIAGVATVGVIGGLRVIQCLCAGHSMRPFTKLSRY